MPRDPFLMKVLLKKGVCGSREQCTRPIESAKTHFSKKKKRKKRKKKKTQTLETCETRYPNTTLMSKLYPVVSEWF